MTTTDFFRDTGPEQAAFRLGDLFEVARRARRFGAQDVLVHPQVQAVRFYDPRVNAGVRLEILPWFDRLPGWHWYAIINLPDGFIMGPMGLKRQILHSPYPRQVIRVYQQSIWWEMRSFQKKMNKGR